MDDQNKDVHDSDQTVIRTSDIQSYLASFNREIEEHAPVNNENHQSEETDSIDETGDTSYVNEGTSGSHLEDFQVNNADQADYAATTYYAVSDGSLYTATDQPGSSQQISLHSLSPSESSQVINNHSGMQQIILAVGESNGMFCGSKEGSINHSNMSLLKGNIQGELIMSNPISTDGGSETTEASAKFIAMNPRVPSKNHIKEEEVESMEPPLESMEGENSHAQTIMLVQQPNAAEQLGESGQTIVTGVGEELHIDEERTLQMMANIAEQAAAAKVSGSSNNSVIVNDGVSYQTVTIVPSDTNPGEVSYVLYLSQTEDMGKNSENVDMSVYDFNDGERYAESMLTDNVRPDVVKMRALRVSPRKSQVSSTTHMCNYCNYTSPKRYLLSRHMKSHSDERPHKCSVCERGFKTLASLQNHVNTHTGTRPHNCRDCESCFTTSGELVRHVRYKHTHEKPHRCTECDYASVELSKLKRHMRCHTGERPYQCPHCTYASPDTYKLKRHLRIHTGEKPYVCDICQSRFTQSNSLKAHKLIHSGNKPVFQCQFCPTTCGRKTDLRIHVQKLHSCDRSHKCKRCGKMFSDRYSYKIHVKTHEGEKCFKCDLCPYASVSQRHLETHMFIHTDQKPFHCDECDQAFRQKQLLKRHKNLYHDPYYIPPVPKEKNNECTECGKAFRHKGNLIRHLAVHDPKASAEEREEAMLIGRPKGPGELEDGEEDYEYGEDEYERRKDGQQLVVFEVIQIPQSNGNIVEDQILTMGDGQTLTLNSGDSQSYTIIQQAPDDSVNMTESLTESESGDVVSNRQRRRGRPRKYPIVTEVHAAEIDEEAEKNDSDSAVEILDKKTRHLRKKKLLDEDFSEEMVFPHNPAKRGRPPKTAQRSPRIVQIVSENKSSSSHKIIPSETLLVQDSESMMKHEEEMTRKRLEQKQRDMDECFGFNEENGDDDNVILAMPAAPGYQNFTQHMTEQQKA